MNILNVHNFYQQPGGEDTAFYASGKVYTALGHHVFNYTATNAAVANAGRVELAKKTVWNAQIANNIYQTCLDHKIYVVNFHNTFPLISPAAYGAARKAGAKVIQWLHNYRLLCASATFFRDGKVCEDCLRKIVPLNGVLHRCYRGSLSASAVTAAMIGYHKLRGTWANDIDKLVALSRFARDKFVEGGFPIDKIAVLCNYLGADPSIGDGSGGYALFVGRLSSEKGIATLLKAWDRISIPLKIVGDGPFGPLVAETSARNLAIEWLGRLDTDGTMAMMRQAKFLICPSESYEGALPYSIIEAFAAGTPVLASDIGCMPEHVKRDQTGLLFTAGDTTDLATKAHEMDRRCHSMRGATRRHFSMAFSPERAYAAFAGLLQEICS